MTPGGADPDAVLDIISEHVPPGPQGGSGRVATDVVEALEASGYRIVRAGMVPRLDELEHVAAVLEDVTPRLKDMTKGAETGAVTVRWLTALATVTLGLDLDDVDDPQGTK